LGYAAESDPFVQQHHSITTVADHEVTTQTLGGSPLWMLFERGLIYGDTSGTGAGSSPLRRMLGDGIKWVDVTNPTPFIVSAMLFAVGVISKGARR
jgi:hypothetical protein